MRKDRGVRIIAAAAALLGGAGVLFAEGPFASMSFDEAMKAAAKSGKPIFIDFYTTWCGPCKMLDQSTWKDEKVIAWLGDKVIALKIDAEKEAKLAEKYKITGYPTLLFLKPDGTEMERLTGYTPADEFLSEGAGIIKGKDKLTRAKEAVEQGGQNKPALRLDYGRALWSKDKNEEALREFLWCFDKGVELDPDFAGQMTFLVMLLDDLGKEFPAARTALDDRREAARKRVLTGNGSKQDVRAIIAINRRLDAADENIALYDRVRAEHPGSKSAAEMAEALLDELLKEHRYADIAKDVDVKARADAAFAEYKPTPVPVALTGVDTTAKPPPDPQVNRLSYQVTRYYQVLVGLKRKNEAAELARRLLAISETAQVYNQLAWNGYLTSAPADDNVDQARKAYDLSEGKDAAIVDTLARVLNARGKKQEAVTLVRKALDTAATPYEKRVLEGCLKDING